MESETLSVVTANKRLARAPVHLGCNENGLAKRFKGNVPTTPDEVNRRGTQAHFEGQKFLKNNKFLEEESFCLGLSPITEIAQNLFDASLNSPCTSINGDSRSAAGRRLRQFRTQKSLYKNSDVQQQYDGDDAKTLFEGAKGAEVSSALISGATSGERIQIDISKMRTFNSLSSTLSQDSSSTDDEYMSALSTEQRSDQELPLEALHLPSNLDTLLSGRLKQRAVEEPNESCHNLPETNPSSSTSASPTISNDNAKDKKHFELSRPKVRRCLSLYLDAQSSPNNSFTDFKRPQNTSAITTPKNPSDDGVVPVTSQKSAPTLSQSSSKISSSSGGGRRPSMLRKSISLNDAQIMTALARSGQIGESDLIGDLSKPYALPTLITGQRHSDLKTISSETLARILSGDFKNIIDNFHIVDCRYPYEYNGGHINGGVNLYNHDLILQTFPLTDHDNEESPTKSGVSAIPASAERNVIIFHCEFSSERGPKMMRFLRSNDRAIHSTVYPALNYPEIYLLHNGYKEFHEKYAELCIPNGGYVPMLSPKYNDEYRYYRTTCKSWAGDCVHGSSTQRLKKLRSRLDLNTAENNDTFTKEKGDLSSFLNS